MAKDISLSNITILKPREPNFTPSSRITTDFIVELEALIDRDKWQNRKEFFYQTLAFCLSLPNLWRFPKEAFIQGQAAFVWLYIIFMLTIGSCLLFFEVALGQYSSKGFAKVFAMCPLFEGISYAMAFYCVIVSIYYNMLNAYSFIYVFASFNNASLKYETCDVFPTNVCVKGSPNQSLTPEYVYFQHRVVYYSTTDFDETHNFYEPNWRNVGVLFFLWVLVCIVILRGIRTVKWPAMVYCPIPYVVLTASLVAALTRKGANMGLKAMFLMNFKDLLQAGVWRRAFEQTIIALGLGMGPLITLGSYSKFQSPADRDSLLLCICTLIGSLLSGSVLFCSAGILAHERNQTMNTVLKEAGQYPKDFSVHVVFSQLFSRLPTGISNVLSLLFFLMFLLAGWYSLITYTETFIVSCYTFFPSSYRHKIYTNLGICMFCFVVGVSLASRVGYRILLALDRVLVALGLVVIVLCELCAVIYIYGIRDFSDDIDFMLGFFPNLYILTVWMFAPLILMILLFDLMYSRLRHTVTIFEKDTTIITGVIIILPIIVVGLYNIYLCYKAGDLRQVLAPREVILLDEEDYLLSRQGSGHGNKSNTKWFKLPGTKILGANDTAGPSNIRTVTNTSALNKK